MDAHTLLVGGLGVGSFVMAAWVLRASDLRPDRLRRAVCRSARDHGIRLDEQQISHLVTWRARQVRLGSTLGAVAFCVSMAVLEMVDDSSWTGVAVGFGAALVAKQLGGGLTPLTRTAASDVRVAGLEPRTGSGDESGPESVLDALVLLVPAVALVALAALADTGRTAVIVGLGIGMVALSSCCLLAGRSALRRSRAVADQRQWQLVEVERRMAGDQAHSGGWLASVWPVLSLVWSEDLAWGWRAWLIGAFLVMPGLTYGLTSGRRRRARSRAAAQDDVLAGASS